MTNFTIRPAKIDDIAQIHAIYSQSVIEDTASWEYDPPTLQEMQRRYEALLSENFPYLVAVKGDEVLGYAYASHYRPRIGYRFCVENSIYVSKANQGIGVGKALLKSLINECEKYGFTEIIAVIGDSANAASIALHKSCGFYHVGLLPNVGFKFNKWLDSVLMQCSIAKANK